MSGMKFPTQLYYIGDYNQPLWGSLISTTRISWKVRCFFLVPRVPFIPKDPVDSKHEGNREGSRSGLETWGPFPLTNQTSWYKNASVIAKMVQPEEVPDEFSTWTSTITVWETTALPTWQRVHAEPQQSQTRERWQVRGPMPASWRKGKSSVATWTHRIAFTKNAPCGGFSVTINSRFTTRNLLWMRWATCLQAFCETLKWRYPDRWAGCRGNGDGWFLGHTDPWYTNTWEWLDIYFPGGTIMQVMIIISGLNCP